MAEDLQINARSSSGRAETLGDAQEDSRALYVFCDECERTAGDNTAPPPLAYSVVGGF